MFFKWYLQFATIAWYLQMEILLFYVFMSSKIQDGEIYAIINQKDGMVRFLEDPEQYKTCEMIEHIDSSIQRYTCSIRKLVNVGLFNMGKKPNL